MLTKEQIRDRLKTYDVWIETSRTPLFPEWTKADGTTTNAVPERKMRYVVALHFNGDGVCSRTVDIEKVKEDAETPYTADDVEAVKFSMIPVAPAKHQEIPEDTYDIESPILALEGGVGLCGKVSGNSINSTVIYWDSPEI